jgi:23S rRNA (guanosine2251-2'-O)-methyltransferase
MNELRKKERQEIVYGIHPVIEAVKAGKEIDKILVQKGLRSEGFTEFMGLLKESNIPYQFVPQEKLNRVSRKNHQGVIAFISPVTFFNIEDVLPQIFEDGKVPFLLIMDRITDVRNFGAILRSAACAGVDAVVIPSRNSAQLNSDTVKSSAGAIYKVPLCRSSHLKETISFLKDSGLRVVSATEKAERDYFSEDMTVPLAIIMGSEGEGVSGEYLALSDRQIKITMPGEIGSLNVSVAAGILMFEVVRQRQS